MFVVLTVCLVLGHTGRFARSGSCVSGYEDSGWCRVPNQGNKKGRPVSRAALLLSDAFYGAYVIVRVPATLWIVTVIPCVKVVGYVSLATVLRALT